MLQVYFRSLAVRITNVPVTVNKNGGMQVEDNMRNLKNRMYLWVLDEMEQAEKTGLLLSVEGTPYTLEEAEELALVMEDSYYMKNYTGDDSGKIVQIDFERIGSI